MWFTDPEALSGTMLSVEDMPSMCKPELWARLIALRDAKVSLETDTAQLHNTVQLLADQLEVLQEEEALLQAELTAAEQVMCTTIALPSICTDQHYPTAKHAPESQLKQKCYCCCYSDITMYLTVVICATVACLDILDSVHATGDMSCQRTAWLRVSAGAGGIRSGWRGGAAPVRPAAALRPPEWASGGCRQPPSN